MNYYSLNVKLLDIKDIHKFHGVVEFVCFSAYGTRSCVSRGPTTHAYMYGQLIRSRYAYAVPGGCIVEEWEGIISYSKAHYATICRQAWGDCPVS